MKTNDLSLIPGIDYVSLTFERENDMEGFTAAWKAWLMRRVSDYPEVSPWQRIQSPENRYEVYGYTPPLTRKERVMAYMRNKAIILREKVKNIAGIVGFLFACTAFLAVSWSLLALAIVAFG